MIKINLLPQEMAGGRGAKGPSMDAAGSAVVALVLLVLFGVNIGLAGYMLYTYNESKSEFQDTKRRADEVEAQLKDREERFQLVKLSMERMEQLIAVAESLDPADRLLWSRKLNMLPLLVPQGIFLTEVRVVQQVREVETDESIAARTEWEQKRQGPPPEQRKVPVYQQTLTLAGIAHVDQGTETQRLEQIVAFYRNLLTGERQLPFDDDDTRFLEGFTPSITPSAVSVTEVEGREVSRFQFTMRTRQLRIN